jgi:hypothetical protein
MDKPSVIPNEVRDLTKCGRSGNLNCLTLASRERSFAEFRMMRVLSL